MPEESESEHEREDEDAEEEEAVILDLIAVEIERELSPIRQRIDELNAKLDEFLAQRANPTGSIGDDEEGNWGDDERVEDGREPEARPEPCHVWFRRIGG